MNLLFSNPLKIAKPILHFMNLPVNILEKIGSNQTLAPFESLEKLDNYYTQVLDDLPAAVYMCDQYGYLTYYNPAAVKLWGRQPELGKDLWCGSFKIYYPDGNSMPLDLCPMAKTLKTGKAVKNEEILVETPDGKLHNVQPHPSPIFDANGNICGAVNMLVDLTEHRRDEQSLWESEKRFSIVANNAPVMIWMSTAQNECIFVNKSWLQFTGRPVHKELGRGWLESIHPDDVENVVSDCSAAFAKHESFYMEFRLKNNEGKYKWVSSKGTPRQTPNGKFDGFIGACNDIHDTKIFTNELEKLVSERTRDLKEANQNLQRNNKELEQFAYVASHDLQEPLRKIKIFLGRLEERSNKAIDEQSHAYFDKIRSSTDRMSKLINDILNYSRLVNLDKEFEETDLNEIFNNVLTDFELKIEQKKAVILADNFPVIKAIPLQMNQLFHNLISNALKFSKENIPPHISISCKMLKGKDLKVRLSEVDESREYYDIMFKDNGIGFDPEFAKSIFLIFHRLSSRNTFEGSGIGLALCKKIVNIHDGDIYADSIENEGTTFHVLLPRRTKFN